MPSPRERAVEIVELAGDVGKGLLLGLLVRTLGLARPEAGVLGQASHLRACELRLRDHPWWRGDRATPGRRFEANALQTRQSRDEDARLAEQRSPRRAVARGSHVHTTAKSAG